MKKILLYLLFAFNLGAIIFLWTNSSHYYLTAGGGSGLLIAFGRLAGLLMEFFILLQLILIGRITFVEQQFGHDRLNQLHRWVGYGIAIFILGHPLLLTLGYSHLSEVSFIAQFFNFIKNWEDVFKAFLAVFLFIGVIITSIVIVKKRLRYETWHFTHLLMYVAIALAFGHQTNTGDMSAGNAMYYWFTINFLVFGLILFYRWLAPLYRFFLHRFYIDKVVRETADIYSIYLKGKNLARYKFLPGQFANLTFLQSSMWFTHPFSFSAAPNGEYLRFSIKTSGDFTNKISHLKANTKVIIDGPLGVFTAKQAKKTKFLLLAGGIGVTPIRALAQQLAMQKADCVILYGCKTEADIVFKNEFLALNVKHFFLLSQTKNQALGNLLPGRISAEKIKLLAPDFLEREIYLCGPNNMISGVLADLKTLNIPNSQIHYEKFNY
ncbi:MAG: ferredoxin reductase family protein [Candidatus Doudnabacteria bacterium]|jgi:predicted ferric reductase